MVASCKCDLHPFTVETAPALTASSRRIASWQKKKKDSPQPSHNTTSLLVASWQRHRKKRKKGKTRLPAGGSSAACAPITRPSWQQATFGHDGTAKVLGACAPILTKPTWQRATFGHDGTAKKSPRRLRPLRQDAMPPKSRPGQEEEKPQVRNGSLWRDGSKKNTLCPRRIIVETDLSVSSPVSATT